MRWVCPLERARSEGLSAPPPEGSAARRAGGGRGGPRLRTPGHPRNSGTVAGRAGGAATRPARPGTAPGQRTDPNVTPTSASKSVEPDLRLSGWQSGGSVSPALGGGRAQPGVPRPPQAEVKRPGGPKKIHPSTTPPPIRGEKIGGGGTCSSVGDSSLLQPPKVRGSAGGRGLPGGRGPRLRRAPAPLNPHPAPEALAGPPRRARCAGRHGASGNGTPREALSGRPRHRRTAGCVADTDGGMAWQEEAGWHVRLRGRRTS